MADADANATQIRRIEAHTGQTLAQLSKLLADSGIVKFSARRQHLMDTLGLGYGDANAVVVLSDRAAAPALDDPLDAIYAGPKAALRPLHEAVMAAIAALGPFEIAPKKGYLSLRRQRQFAMVGPAAKGTVEIGLNAKDLPEHARLKRLPPGGMCQATVRIAGADELDATLKGWLRRAYDAAG